MTDRVFFPMMACRTMKQTWVEVVRCGQAEEAEARLDLAKCDDRWCVGGDVRETERDQRI